MKSIGYYIENQNGSETVSEDPKVYIVAERLNFWKQKDWFDKCTFVIALWETTVVILKQY